MAINDTLSAKLQVKLSGTLARAMGSGGHTGTDVLNHEKNQIFTDGTGANQASGWFSTTITVTTSSNTISFANADPTGGLGDDTWTLSPAELKVRAIVIENTDTTNYVTLGFPSTGITGWVAGTTNSGTVIIPAGGVLAATFPSGLNAMTDGADDEVTLQANTASVVVKLSILFG
jgi:hypothetical protein